MVSDYLGSSQAQNRSTPLQTRDVPNNGQKVRQIDLHRLYTMYSDSETSTDRIMAGAQALAEFQGQLFADVAYRKFAEIAYPGDEERQKAARRLTHKAGHMQCEMEGHKAFREHCAGLFDANSGFALQFHQVIVNVCHDVVEEGMNLAIAGAAATACKETKKYGLAASGLTGLATTGLATVV